MRKKVVCFAITDLNHLDVVIPAEPKETGNDSNDTDVVPGQIGSDHDNDNAIITYVIEFSLDQVEFLGGKSSKIQSDVSEAVQKTRKKE